MLIIPLQNYKSNGDFVPEGTYHVVVDDVDQTKSKTSGNEMVVVRYRVVGGEHDSKIIRENFVLVESMLWKIAEFLQAVGIATPRKQMQLQESQLLNKHLVLTTKVGSFKGRDQTEVTSYRRLADVPEFAAATSAQTVAEDFEDFSDEEEPPAFEEEEEETVEEKPEKASAPVSEEDVDLDDLDSLEV